MSIELIGIAIAILTFVGSCIFTIFRVAWIVSNALSDMKREFNALLSLKEAEFDAKIGRQWQRFDEYKVHIEGEFVRRDMCSVVHTNNATATNEFRCEMLRRFESIEKKIDSLMLR